MKVGDRVRYICGQPISSADLVGEVGRVIEVVTRRDGDHAHVKWDNPSIRRTFPFVANLEIISMLSTTRPLFVVRSPTIAHNDRLQVDFITETSEGHVLVQVPQVDRDGHNVWRGGWMIFDKQGKHVRGQDGYGSALTLENDPVETVVYQRVADQEKGYIYGAAYNTEAEARSHAPNRRLVKITSRDGLVVSVELV